MSELDMASYEVGYRDGENSAHADWALALEDVLPEGFDVSPQRVAQWIQAGR